MERAGHEIYESFNNWRDAWFALSFVDQKRQQRSRLPLLAGCIYSHISVYFFMLPMWSYHSPAFSVHSIIYIGYSSSNHQFTPVSGSQAALSGMAHLTYGTSFFLLFVFLISLVHHHHSVYVYHHHALILDRLLTFLMAFSTFLKIFPP